MKITCNYNELLKDLTDVANVAEDSLSNESVRNIVFVISKGKLTLMGVNAIVALKRECLPEYYTVDITDDELSDDKKIVQIKAKELLGFLNSYKTVRRTNVESVSFTEDARNNIVCSVVEVKKREDNDMCPDEELPHYLSSWTFNVAPMQSLIASAIVYTAPEEGVVSMDSRALCFHTKTLFPLMINAPTMFGKLTVSKDYFVAFDPSFATFMHNKANDGSIFEDVCLPYRGVAFLEKFIGVEDNLELAKSPKHLYIKHKNSEAFISYETNLAICKSYLDIFKKDYAFVIDRIMFKDILKRLSLVNDSVEFIVKREENEILLKNSKYSQGISILQSKNLDMIEGDIHFSITPNVLNKAIIGSDDEFPNEVFVYYCPLGGGNIGIVFSYSTGAWFSVLRVKSLSRSAL